MNVSSVVGLILIGFLLLLIAGVGCDSYVVIEPGHRGVIISQYGGTNTETVFGEGFHAKFPWMERVQQLSVQTEKYTAKAEASSKDLQEVATEITLNFALQEDKLPQIYQQIGMLYESKIIQPITQEIVKAITAQYTAEELVTKRPEVRKKIADQFEQRLKENYIRFTDVSITNFKFSPSYDKAIEEKQVAEQKALEEEQKKKRSIIEAEAERDQRRLRADAELYEMQKHSEGILLLAQKQAEANQVLNDSITDKILKSQMIAKWDGIMPRFLGGDGMTPLFNVGDEPTKQGK